VVEYYSDDSVQITSDILRVDGRTYPLRELVRVWHARSRRSWRRLANRGMLAAAVIGPLVAAAIGVLIALLLSTSFGVTVAIVGVFCLLGLCAVPVADMLLDRMDRSYDRGARRLEIWASWHGRAVLLLTTDDAHRFGQIYRALQRAMESG
jgi:acyl-CoA synthetase (AMP-forming)/AMP-acid ligase II